jgi:hypothetical protein
LSKGIPFDATQRTKKIQRTQRAQKTQSPEQELKKPINTNIYHRQL